ncbi:MAG: hypothetical protein R3D29_00150 [Nitratireductor sp.]
MFRTIFWLGLVIAFIPVNPADLKEGQRPVSPFETLVHAIRDFGHDRVL